MSSNVQITPFGGVRENGKNMYAVEVDEDIYILDCGLKYPENELLGIDIVIPDFSYLRENTDRIVGVFLTHGHADAIGALPYFLNEFNVPVFGSELTIELAKIQLQKDPKAKKFDDFHVVDEKTEIDFGSVTVSFFRTTHSIPDSMGIVLQTDAGQVVYTGDFKFDQTAMPGYQTDFARLAEIGSKGVLALLSDSASAENFDQPVSEHEIASYVLEAFKYHNGRIIVASVASNILRVQQVLDAAEQSGRKVALMPGDVESIVKTAVKLGKLRMPENVVVPLESIGKLKPTETVILQTGRMGEPIKALQRMSNKQEGKVNIEAGDLVFITTTPSHSMETVVAKTRDMIYRAGADVKAIADDLNSSGHATKRDLQLMMNFMKPKYFIPIQGEYRLLDSHAEFAKEVGIPADHIFIAAKGDQLRYDGDDMHLAGSIEIGDTMIDGIGVGDIGNIVLRDRKILSEDGIFVAVVTIDRKKKKIISTPKITSRGFVYVKTSKDLMQESAELVKETVQSNLDNKEFDWGHLKQAVREKLNHYLWDQTKRHPVILPVIMEVNQHHRRHKKAKPADSTAETPETEA
ncbi:RNase J family beta-CASP ribonuclease [Lactobacillus sp.] [Lactiplantibacillus mudanjiangensis]|uniref:ribonuclease J n=1 Tax=Lactiplantibacillus mudanjiangensis TaxID=1296538 RepID=UPI001014EF60|nr:ribonuclease J [Lactiplantibacillus mudanjiangensis]VDG20717.1 RNase J family beta-CASP ribonuclease [Lactobacillus sp.] [Lactiplantibacillus mudanjiangensis]VDG30605.1 RNase J family beta-CASP ribonuclease [Lactobacillus sp.] [Lactiplantibacillus mudanjiangensis]